MLIGLDIGTSATKGIVMTPDGDVCAVASSPHDISHPADGWSEQDPAMWWSATVDVIRRLLADERVEPTAIQCVGLSGQMHGSVVLDEAACRTARDGAINAVRPALLWNDQRTADWCEEIERAAGGRRALVSRYGNRAVPGFTLPKILWLRDQEPDSFQRIHQVINPKDFIRLQLTGNVATDVGDASGMLLLDIETRAWDTSMAEAVGVSPDVLPPVRPSAMPIGVVTSWAAAETGLPVDTPVVAGSGDNMCGAIGAGIVMPDHVLVTLGTSGVVYAHADQPRCDLSPDDANEVGRIQTMCAADGTALDAGQWCHTGCMLSAAGAVRWARDVLAADWTFDQYMAHAATAPPGCDGLLFLPHLHGERCPYPDPAARGAWIGLSQRHTSAHMMRAVLEGVSGTLRMMLDIMRGMSIPSHTIRLGGGGSQSAFWRQILADNFNASVSTVNTREGPAYGAALLAAVGVGEFQSVAEACAVTVTTTETRKPSDDVACYVDVRQRLAATYRALHAMQRP
ncbi:MAG: xylulokinase [Planctomycetota bacterium]